MPHRQVAINSNVVSLVTHPQRGYRINDFITIVPSDHDTVWGFLAKEEPNVLDIMVDPVGGLLVDQHRAQVTSLLLGHPTHLVAAPAAVWAAGITEVPVFKLEVLRQVFPT
jgi:hypothetical protein